jgi:hypothetical protein
MYRGLVASTLMARLFGDEALWNTRYRSLKGFEKAHRDMIF